MQIGTFRRRGALALAIAGLLVTGSLGLGQHAPAHADGVCDYYIYLVCGGPPFLQSSVAPGEVVLDWDFNIDIPQQVTIERDHTQIAAEDVATDAYGEPVSPTQYTDTGVAAGASYLYTVCFTYINSDPGCRDTPSEPVPGQASPPHASSSGSGGGSSGAPAPVSLPKPTGVAVGNVTPTKALVSWTLPAGTLSGLQIQCQDVTDPILKCAVANGATAGFWTYQVPSQATAPIVTVVWNMAAGYVPSSFQFSDLLASHQYSVSVCTTQGANAGCSDSVSFTTLPYRATATAPSNLQFVGQNSDTSATISFASGAGGDEIQVQCTDITATVECTPYAVAEDATSAKLVGLTVGHDYVVDVAQVQLSDDTGGPAPSNQITIHVVKVSPPTPTDLYVGDRSATSLTLFWTSHADQATGVIETDVYRDGVKLIAPPTSALTGADIRQAQSYALAGQNGPFFVDHTPLPSDPRETVQYVVCNVYQQYRGTTDEKGHTSCSNPLVVSNFTLDPNAQVKPHQPIPPVN